jgi:hypothetical protein
MLSSNTSFTIFTACLLACSYFVYTYALARLEQDMQTFSAHRTQLMQAMNTARTQYHALTQQLAIQDDPAWIEWNLIHSLGLVPEEHSKVIFIPQTHLP